MNNGVTAIRDWGAFLMAAFGAVILRLMEFLPLVIAAAVILVIGWMLSGVLARLTSKVLRHVGFQNFAERIGLSGFIQRAGVQQMDASTVVGEAVKWSIRLVFLQMAADALHLRQVTLIFNTMIAFIPNIIVAVVIIMLAEFLGRLLRSVVQGSAATAGVGGSSMLAGAAYWAIVLFGAIAALNQLGIAPMVVNTLFVGLVATLVLALGLSFGLGGRETAAALTHDWLTKAYTMNAQAKAQAAASAAAAPLVTAPPAVAATERTIIQP
ncbi:MAG: hypothetical protein M3Y56_09320 [Armatimonadota bacterium]|nr:hypothetical protein [Armatimonadota bacterium]